MTQLETIQAHQQLCEEIYQCVLDENRFLRQHLRSPDRAFVDRKKSLLEKLEKTLAALRTLPAASARDTETQAQLENTRARILQILQLDKENEQLLLRYSLVGSRALAVPALTPSVSVLQKIYSRTA
jgi:hypothetical protein